jgi:hypothetical protein
MRRKIHSEIAFPWHVEALFACAAMTVSALVISLGWMVFANMMNDSFGRIFARMEATPSIFFPFEVVLPFLVIAFGGFSVRLYIAFRKVVTRLLEVA